MDGGKRTKKAMGFKFFFGCFFSFFCSLAIDASVISLCLISVLVVNSDDENNQYVCMPDLKSTLDMYFQDCSDNILS